MTSEAISIVGMDHIGIRIADREASLKFYGALGFAPEEGEGSVTGRVVGLINDRGIRINLIFNGQPRPESNNILMDIPEKWPGWTHPAFVVVDLDQVVRWAEESQITITEGPVTWGRRRALFMRDPDGNVLEFDEILDRN